MQLNIQSVSSQSLQNNGNLQKMDKLHVNPFKKEFSLDMTKKEKVHDTKETLEKMLSDINDLKDKIDFEVTVENVMNYKTLVKSFLTFYTEHALQTKDIIYRNGRNNEKLTIVKKIDDGIKELDDTMSLLDTKSGHLDMLRRIGEINGMIVNLRV
ncbi:UDP-N-acetylenolpyruvoylglucosamine reductase [Bacillus cereus]|uniref:UDP-N-acetylenolpyruvoylglucosamine reductase n=2 Tax=Bacillus cereus group TaxID=86661 RepID=A0A9X6XW58_BACCE|nr:UDP-N-acetylenolpyruvoylglucosamine reductase [Bacillus cereus]PFJ31008.1 UDP-N-acetylenolpyruvoylglucosamine reductase [Bacillus thuringiensis]PGP12812.1 UDP-N-acetylenolpyruvoylglucosamine reductase [Bacillus cereus]